MFSKNKKILHDVFVSCIQLILFFFSCLFSHDSRYVIDDSHHIPKKKKSLTIQISALVTVKGKEGNVQERKLKKQESLPKKPVDGMTVVAKRNEYSKLLSQSSNLQDSWVTHQSEKLHYIGFSPKVAWLPIVTVH